MAYIKLEDLRKFPIRKDHYDKEHGSEHFIFGVESVLEYAEYLPIYTFDSTETKHGYWIPQEQRDDNPSTTCKCSCCGELRGSYYGDVSTWAYCPCGAQMDAEAIFDADDESE